MGRLRNFSQSLKAAAFPNTSGSSSPTTAQAPETLSDSPTYKQPPTITREASSTSTLLPATTSSSSPLRPDIRPISQFYDPPIMGSSREDNIDELRPVFSFLNSHQNKLYQEGYFLKLNDLDTNGKPNTDRNWTECFAQLVGTVLSLWDAAALDAAGQDGEVSPTFINLADASIKMIETLPTRNASVQPLQNVLSVSTAGKNRYLLHFNSLHSLTQWTAGIRLAMFEHSSLHELYTGSLIAGKGKLLNNIKSIMGRLRYREEDWCRVRFGAGTPWRRCWFTIDPPDEKEWQKVNKQLKKKGAYERTSYPKGTLKFFDTKKTKKATPIATISDVYAAYAVYPESKPLIDQSTLVKMEGKITIHSKPESNTEGFVFVMPEVHPAVSGFEILLRFLFPIYDTFGLYGRPGRLVADTLDARGLMFAMPKDRRYGYLDIIDVAGLIHADESEKWTERDWRKRTKELVSRRMSVAPAGRPSGSSENPRRSLGARPALRFGDHSPVDVGAPNQSTDAVFQLPKRTLIPAAAQSTPSIQKHVRSVSESMSAISPSKRRQSREYVPSRLAGVQQESSLDRDISPPPLPKSYQAAQRNEQSAGNEVMQSTNSSDSDLQQPRLDPQDVTRDLPVMTPPNPVAPPTFNHQANDQPSRRPRDRPDLRREKSRMSNATLLQLADANKSAIGSGHAGAVPAATHDSSGRHEEHGRGVNEIHDLEDIRIQANPALAAVNQDSPHPRHVSEAPWQNPVPRPVSQHSIARKPLPTTSQPATPTELEHPHQSRKKMEDPELLPVFGGMHLPSMLPNEDRSRRLGGVRKTVGDPTYDQTKRTSDIIDIDFGITRSLNPTTSRPNSGGRVSPLLPSQLSPTTAHHEEKRPQYGRVSPVADTSRPNSYVWQPGSQPAGRDLPRALTPEEFVQQRYAASRGSYGHSPRRNKSPSEGREAQLSPATTPSPRRLQKRNNSRSTSADFNQPQSSHAPHSSKNFSPMSHGPLLGLSDRTRGDVAATEYGGHLQGSNFDSRTMGSYQTNTFRTPPHSPQYPGYNMQQLQSQHLQQSYATQQGRYQQHQQQNTAYPPQQFASQYPPYRPRSHGNSQQH